MKLSDFLEEFIDKLNKKGMRHCVLRNYDGLPFENYGNDIDFLFEKNDIDSVVTILFEINRINVTGILKRPYVVSVFINGVNWGEGQHAIEIDLVSSIGWKGLSYLSVHNVLERAIEIPSSGGLLKKPSSYHEALISFFSSYLVGGWIKEKYQPKVREIASSAKFVGRSLTFSPRT